MILLCAYAVFIDGHKHIQLLDAALKSAREAMATRHEMRFLVIANYVAEAYSDRLKSLCNEAGAVLIYNRENCVASGWNLAVRVAPIFKADLIAINNLDVTYGRECFDELVAAMDDPEMVLASADIVPTQDLNAKRSGKKTDGGSLFGCIVVRLSFIEVTGGFDENYRPIYREDNDMHRRCRSLGLGIALIHDARISHVGQSSFKLADNPDAAKLAILGDFKGLNTVEKYDHMKWGSDASFVHPFNNPNNSPKYWPILPP